MENPLSYKNKLQELCQNQKGPLPIYQHKPKGDQWKCILQINNGKFTGYGKTKKEADQNAAKMALLSTSHFKQKKTKFNFAGCLLVLIDLENSPNYNMKKWSHIIWDCAQVEAFVGKLSSHATKDLKTLYPFVNRFYTINSAVKDAVDHAISFRAGTWFQRLNDTHDECRHEDGIVIISRDKFAFALLDIIRQKDSNLKLYSYASIDECFANLETLVL